MDKDQNSSGFLFVLSVILTTIGPLAYGDCPPGYSLGTFSNNGGETCYVLADPSGSCVDGSAPTSVETATQTVNGCIASPAGGGIERDLGATKNGARNTPSTSNLDSAISASSSGRLPAGACITEKIGSDRAAFYGGFRSKSGEEILSELKSQDCGLAATLADKCCGNPASCLTADPSADPSANASADAEAQDSTWAGQAFQFLATAAVSVPAGSITDACGRMKDTAYATATLQTYISGKCSVKVNACKSSCTSKLAQAKSDYQKLDKVELRGPCAVDIETIGSVKDALDSLNNLCISSANANVAVRQQMVASQMSGKFASLCQNQANNQQNAFANPDCAQPAQAVTPFCQYQCNRLGAAQDPNCAALLSALRKGSGPGYGAGGVANGSNANAQSLYGSLPTSPENPQLAIPPTTEALSKGLAKTEGGGASGGLGGGGGGSGANNIGGGNSGGPAGKASVGYDTSILRGLASGNGYSGGAHMGSGSSGGYGNYGGGTNNIFGNPLNLKNYLPGGKDAAPGGPIRGLASKSADIGPAHEDIFEKISNRFYVVCLRDGLYDCDTLKKMKRAVGGN